MPLTNVQVSELFALKAMEAEGHSRKAYERASREAMAWREEASDLAAQDRDLTELAGIGPKLSAVLRDWFDSPPEVPEPPPERTGFMSMAEALRTVRANPQWRGVLRADLQMHTTYSDGVLGVVEMAEAAHDYGGYTHLAITDHSAGQRIPSGMDVEAIAAQRVEIDEANQAAGGRYRILQGIEMNLTPTGEGDTPSEVLARLDIVLGSFHSKLREKEDQTARYLAAVLNPDIQVLAHPQGRMYGRRRGLNADWEKVLGAVALLDKAVEFDCNPNRQDLRPEILRIAADAGVRVSLGTDAHSPYELTFITYGIAALCVAGIGPERVINTMPVEELLAWVASVREGAG
ncbi:MAG TPA: hypothetical protein VM840_13760 [Actinomycetota bacterium]|nr:hypothetical protein [Actinomycetota bacterium]